MTRTPIRRAVLALGICLAIPPTAFATTYVVTLGSGATFESRYKPKRAPWDAGKVLVYTEVGNWISLSRADIASIKNSNESKGFGKVLNTTTVELGWAPNDAMSPEALATAMRENPAAFISQTAPAPYTVNQFVEPNATQGIPIYGGMNPLNTNFPLGAAGIPGLGMAGAVPGYSVAPVSREPVTPP